VPAELDFEAADGSIVCYCSPNYLLWGLWVTEAWNGCYFVVKCGNTWKSAHPSVWL